MKNSENPNLPPEAREFEAQQEAQALKALEKAKPFKEPVVTETVMGGPFYRAEEYHQDYYKKNPVRYHYYRWNCGRDQRLGDLWASAKSGELAGLR